jgi:ribosomal protein S18 acetylase RimI-like enzyme
LCQLATTGKSNGIRVLRPAKDLGQLADLMEQAFHDELSHGGERVLQELRLLARLGPFSLLFTGLGSEADGIFSGFVWEQAGRVVGNVTVNCPTGHLGRWQISNVAVEDAYRGRGIGRQLVEAALDLIASRGGEVAYLFVRDTNLAALHLYQSLGFSEVDRTTDLELRSPPVRDREPELRVLRALRPSEGEALYELASVADGPGHRWLSPLRRHQFVRPVDERFTSWVAALATGERESWWGIPDTKVLWVGLTLRTSHLWNRKPHQLKLWVHPSRRGEIERPLARDILTLLAQAPQRPTWVTLPQCEAHAIDALARVGFQEIRTLMLMKRAL